MIKNLQVFREVAHWKRPVHITKAVLAKNYLKLLPNLEVIAITGSVGKTLTQNAVISTLSQKYRVVAADENLDPTFRIPQTILKAKIWDQKLVLEFGVEHPLDMDHYLSIVIPRIAIVTAITPTHLKYFKTQQGVFDEKSKLVASLPKNGYAILNTDDPYCRKMAWLTKAKVIWYGKTSKEGVKISHFQEGLFGSKFRLHFDKQKATVQWKIIGKHHLTSAYAVAAVGIVSGLTLKQIAKGLSQTKPPLHRLYLISTKKVNIIDDTYNSSPEAAYKAIKTLIEVGKNKQKIAVLGEMKDLGDSAKSMHQQLGIKIAKSRVNYLITVGKMASEIASFAKKANFSGKIVKLNNTKEVFNNLRKITNKKSVVLIKGSRHAHLERVVNLLLGRSSKVNCYHCGELS